VEEEVRAKALEGFAADVTDREPILVIGHPSELALEGSRPSPGLGQAVAGRIAAAAGTGETETAAVAVVAETRGRCAHGRSSGQSAFLAE
jgi:hypothetical protein